MIRAIFAIFVLFFISGCSFKHAFFKEDILEQKAIVWSQKGEIYNSLEIKASIDSTYLNQVVSGFSDGENFIVGIHIDDDFEDEYKAGLNNPAYTLTLNGKKAIKVQKLDNQSELFKVVPFKKEWARYYLVKFANSNKKVLKLKLRSRDYGEKVLVFLAHESGSDLILANLSR